MTRDRKRSGPVPIPGRLSTSPAREVASTLQGWQAAVEHLHALGLPAAVDSEFTDRWLRRRGVRADWVAGSGAR